MYQYLYQLSQKERIFVEPSAASGFAGLKAVLEHADKNHFNLSDANHIV